MFTYFKIILNKLYLLLIHFNFLFIIESIIASAVLSLFLINLLFGLLLSKSRFGLFQITYILILIHNYHTQQI